MLQPLNRITSWASSRKGAKIVLALWLAVIVILSGIAPSAKQYAINAGEGSIHENTPAAVAQQVMDEHFPSDEGLPALVVFHHPEGLEEEEQAQISEVSQWLSSAEKPENVASSLPYHELPKAVQERMLSDNKTTMLYHFSLKKDLESDETYETIEQIREWLKENTSESMTIEITGPAGIASDTLALFKNADLVLLFATIGLILVLLIIIYRSPLLALIPLVIAGLVYQAVDRIIGLAGREDWFIIDSQALSIMLILLFAVLTDYCLFVFSRYREELKKAGNKYDAMKLAMSQVGEPILFSGSTVLLAMLTLFTAIFKPYHHFAPVFSIALIVILLGGLTLIPAVFALLGRKAFWPFTPKLETAESQKPEGFWGKFSTSVVKRPKIFASVLLVLLLISSFNVGTIEYSFNLMKSFPKDLSSRQGFEILEQNFPKGKLAPVSIILKADKEIKWDEPFLEKLVALIEEMSHWGGIESISPEVVPDMAQLDASQLPRNFLAKDGHAIKLQVTLDANPYDQEALDTVQVLRENADKLLRESGFEGGYYSLHFAGQTAEQLDVRQMNKRDTILVFSLIVVLITVMLILQTRKLWMAMLMISTILLSYTATVGLGWLIFHGFLGYEAISYRIPVYTFVFLVALGVDYNIMLVSRIREEARRNEWKEAIRQGLAHTGGVISSAGLILAATFAVLITQPMQELFLFGFMMAIGILLDTFLVRGVLLPSLFALVPVKSKETSLQAKTTQSTRS